MWNLNVFHVLLVDHYLALNRGRPLSEPHRVIFEVTMESKLNPILDSRQHYQKLHYLFQWAGYNHIGISWEPAEHRENAQDLH